ncbi:MAG: histidine phosphatase family protein [Nitrospiraceae bacterium]|nr:MAG: histidine phosphatase family protein [Nitrospiraceae bacterium]
MFTKIYLIRHGETEGAEVRRYKGHIDVPLSVNGIGQMKRLAEYLVGATLCGCPGQAHSSAPAGKEKLLNAVYCSDLSRAVKSAEIIAGPHGIKPVIMPELRERNFGIWEGMTFDEIKEKHPDEFNAWASNPLQHSPMSGESTVELRDRAVKALEKIMEDERSKMGDKTIAIVAHGGINRIILCELLGIPLENIFRVEQDYGCLNIIEMWDNYPVVKLINGGTAFKYGSP